MSDGVGPLRPNRRTLALQRFGSAVQGDPPHWAAEQLGPLLRTVFLRDYIAIEHFRREMHLLLNCVESVHQLQRWALGQDRD